MTGLETLTSPRTCPRCRRSFGSATWRLLPLISRIDPAEVGMFLRDWPTEKIVEVRRCECGDEISAISAIPEAKSR